jgi:thiosulfate/3-mercaptopyruvate sulfurtransferase
MSNLIQAEDLYKYMSDEKLVIIDTRFDLKDTNAGRTAYETGHIPGAIYFDLDKDLSGQKSKHGGRHPLPDGREFFNKVLNAGVSSDSLVVVYDDSANMYAGRFWWLLRHFTNVQAKVLDSGYSVWLEQNYPVSTNIPKTDLTVSNVKTTAKALTLLSGNSDLVDAEYIRSNLNNPNIVFIDARARDRFRGENESLDPKAGHIPRAINKPFAENLEGKKFKSPDELQNQFADIPKDKEIIVYCGSGVSANHNLIALEEAGITGAKLYAGSWSDWASYDENPVETEKAGSQEIR